MSLYLIDTDVLIDYSKRQDFAVSWIHQAVDQGADLGICAINLTEFMAGIAPADRPYWYEVLSTFSFWEISPEAARRAGYYRYDFERHGQSLTTTDTLIAAVAIAEGLTLVTKNRKHFPMPELQVQALEP